MTIMMTHEIAALESEVAFLRKAVMDAEDNPECDADGALTGAAYENYARLHRLYRSQKAALLWAKRRHKRTVRITNELVDEIIAEEQQQKR